MAVQAAKNGDTVSVDYVGKLQDGTVFDTSIAAAAKAAGAYNAQRDYAPLTVKLGSGGVIKGFNDGIVGMRVGQTKDVTIPPEEGYGESQEELIINVSTEELRQAGINATIGMEVGSRSGARGKIMAVADGNVTIDFNHPLAGKTLIFTITLVSIK